MGLLGFVAAIILAYSALFHALMLREHREYSWITSIYWTMQTMTTLGYGDIVLDTDLGRGFSILVLTTGVLLLFVLLPFMLIQFVYAPWLEARNAARTPRELPPQTKDHVILTSYGPVEAALIERLEQFNLPYVVIVNDTARALALHDQGVRVMVGPLDSVETYRRARVERASLVATTLPDTANATVVLTVRERSATVPIVATAEWEASTELLKRAGSQQVIQLGELLGREMARRIVGRVGGRTHVIGQLDAMLIAEAPAAGTSLVGQTVRDSRLRERFNLNVVGVWQRGTYAPGSADTPITEDMTLLLSGARSDFDAYEREIRARELPASFAVIIGGGRVGRATSRHLAAAGIEHKIVERASDRVPDWSRYVIGDATDPETLAQAGIDRAASVAITTHDDDVNVYLTLYCRAKRDDVQILSRATLEQNVSTLHRAGADFVLSYVPMEATAISTSSAAATCCCWPRASRCSPCGCRRPWSGRPSRSAGSARTRDATSSRCAGLAVPPRRRTSRPRLEADAELILIGDREDERRFFERYGPSRARKAEQVSSHGDTELRRRGASWRERTEQRTAPKNLPCLQSSVSPCELTAAGPPVMPGLKAPACTRPIDSQHIALAPPTGNDPALPC